MPHERSEPSTKPNCLPVPGAAPQSGILGRNCQPARQPASRDGDEGGDDDEAGHHSIRISLAGWRRCKRELLCVCLCVRLGNEILGNKTQTENGIKKSGISIILLVGRGKR